MYAQRIPEDDVALPDAVDHALYPVLAEEALRLRHAGNLQRIEPVELRAQRIQILRARAAVVVVVGALLAARPPQRRTVARIVRPPVRPIARRSRGTPRVRVGVRQRRLQLREQIQHRFRR